VIRITYPPWNFPLFQKWKTLFTKEGVNALGADVYLFIFQVVVVEYGCAEAVTSPERSLEIDFLESFSNFWVVTMPVPPRK
jgi:hypothetical protein